MLAETEWNQAQITILVWEDPKRALPYAEHALELARASNHGTFSCILLLSTS